MICRICKSKQVKKFLDLGKQPLANSLLKSPKQKEKQYPLQLGFCLNCSLVQLLYTVDPKKLFSKYVWVTGTAQITRDYAQKFCQEILKRQKINNYVLELASNDGTFLKPFIDKGYKVLGIDPAKNITKQASQAGIPTKCEFFGSQAGMKHKPADVVIARNVLPHVKNTKDFVKGMELVLADNGLVVIEFHWAKKIWEDLHYDAIYHEHLCYFSLKSLEFLLNKYNLYIEDLMVSPINAGNLVVFIRKGQVKKKKIVQKYREKEEKMKLDELDTWQRFEVAVAYHRVKLCDLLKDKNCIIGYGASARSSTLLNYCNISLPFIVDANPLKQGLFTAGSHIEICPPGQIVWEDLHYVLVLAWNFKDEIIANLKAKGYKGKFIIPFPRPYVTQ